jgi:hypothetical protein
MKVKIISIGLLALIGNCKYSIAQNNAIFYGGFGDGISTNAYNSLYSNITVGGAGSGNTSGTYLALFTDIRKGGVGDGNGTNNYATTYQEPRVGGVGDGNATNNYASAYQEPRVGGVGDGNATNSYTATYAEPRLGGVGDGYASVVVPSIPLNPLAINLLDFSGAKDGSAHLLNWQTKEDGTTEYFILERSKNAFSWEALSKEITAKGLDKNDYLFKDEAPYFGNNFYRLRIMDTKGKFKYSNIVTLVNQGDNSISIYPNPTANLLNVDLQQMKGESTIMLLNSSGQILQQVQANGTISSLSLENYAVGTYMLKVLNAKQQFVYKILKR